MTIEVDELSHEILLELLDGRLYTTSTLKPSATILDVGTGTGRWAREVARSLADARVYGIDIHPVVPGRDEPSNVVFETVDVMEGIPFNTGTFDLVHSRLLCGGITDWPLYLENLRRLLRKGGAAECIEVELELRNMDGNELPTDLRDWNVLVRDYLESLRLDGRCAGRLSARLEAAGFTNVVEEVHDVELRPARSDDDGEGPLSSGVSTAPLLACRFFEETVDWLTSHMLSSDDITDAHKNLVSRLAQVVRAELACAQIGLGSRWHVCRATK